MATIHVFNNDTGLLETYVRGVNDPMPYVTNGSLLVGRFAGNNAVCWTETNFMRAWNSMTNLYRGQVGVVISFQRTPLNNIDADAHLYSGNALYISPIDRDQMPALEQAARAAGMDVASNELDRVPGLFVSTPYKPSNTFDGLGWPNLFRGTNNNYTFMLQNTLNRLGYNTGGLDGKFGPQTEASVRAWQSKMGLLEDGALAWKEWSALADYNLN